MTPLTCSVPCSVHGCENVAAVEVVLYDVYPDGTVFYEQDHTCSYLCCEHVKANEQAASGERRPRGVVRYPYTNQGHAQGFTIYRPFST